MKISKIINDYFTNQINKKSGDWDDMINIPDIAENVTDEKNEVKNPLCSDFWKYRVFNKPNPDLLIPNYNVVSDCYKNC
jgi:hypothetical protein